MTAEHLFGTLSEHPFVTVPATHHTPHDPPKYDPAQYERNPIMALALHTQIIRPQTLRPHDVRPRRSHGVYVRRRVIVAAICALLVAVGFFARGAVAENTRPVGAVEMPRTVTAVQGDTLWAIAHRLAPQGDVMDFVDRLVELNGAHIVPGQQIRIP